MSGATEREERIFRHVLQQAQRLAENRQDETAFRDKVHILETMTELPYAQIAPMLRGAEASETIDRDRFFSVPFQLVLAGSFLAVPVVWIAVLAGWV